FIALNLSITLALSDKKVVLIGLDLRKPKMASYMNAPQEPGITNFLVGQNNLDEIIRQYEGQANLSFITSGPIPPNPAELILSERDKLCGL
ncbi:MAG: tyrosine protein kinase, partial [Planctomycetota bacterium]